MKITRRNFINKTIYALGITAIPRVYSKEIIKPTRTKAVIQIFLWGGMSHNDTWDFKDSAGYEYNGGVKKLDCKIKNEITEGFSEWFPMMGEQSGKFSVIRSMTHKNNGHETAAYLMQVGHIPGERLSYPCIGACVSWFMRGRPNKLGLPNYIVLTQPQGRFSESGFLGNAYKPFATGGNPNAQRFEVEGIIAKGISDERQMARAKFLNEMDSLSKIMATNPVVTEANNCKTEAYKLILGAGKDVFDLSKEKDTLRDEYGRNTFGQDCLAARRMIEVGIPYICINYPAGWDSHKEHFQFMRRETPNLDRGIAVLFKDLADRGLLDSTIVWIAGEFGRGPKVDWQPPWNGGRNHYGNVFSVIIGGGGFSGGHVIGKSDEKCEEVKDRPVYPYDLLASIYTKLGVDYNSKLIHPEGLEAHILPPKEEVKSAGLLTEIM